MEKYVFNMILAYSLFMSLVILATKGFVMVLLWILGNFAVTMYGLYLYHYFTKNKTT